jgi:hypothetical protein
MKTPASGQNLSEMFRYCTDLKAGQFVTRTYIHIPPTSLRLYPALNMIYQQKNFRLFYDVS